MDINLLLDVVAIIAAIALGVYQIYKSGKRFMEHTNGRKEFLAINKEKLVEAFPDHKLWVVIYALLAVVMFGLAVYFFMDKQDTIYATACMAMGFVSIGFTLECFVTRRSWYYETGFFFESKFYRYRSVAVVTPRNGMFPAYIVRFHAHPDMVVTKKMGMKLMERQEEWKKAKKEKKNAGK